MPDRSRDIELRLETDLTRLDADQAARDVDDVADSADRAQDALDDISRPARQAADDVAGVGRAAQDAGGDVDDLARSGSDLDHLTSGTADARSDLERVGRSADDAGDDLDRLRRDGSRAMDRLARDVDQASDRVDRSLEDVGGSGSGIGDGVEEGTGRGREALGGMHEEAQSTATEMAASFDGSSASIEDAFQEMGANVLATLGPMGAAAGVAAGMLIGAFRGQSEETKQAVSDLTATLIEDGGKISRESILAKLQEFAQDGTLQQLADQATAAGAPVKDFLDAMAGDPDAIDRARSAVDLHTQAIGGLDYASYSAYKSLDKQKGITDDAAQAQQLLNEQTGAAPETLDAFTGALEDFVDPGTVYSDLLEELTGKEQERAQAVADGTADSGDKWEDYAKRVDVSTQQYLDALEKQVAAQEQWSGNMQTLARRGVSEGVLQELSKMGPEGAPLVAKLATASDTELARLNGLMARRATSGVDGLTSSLRDGKSRVTSSAGELATSIISGISTTLQGKQGALAADLASQVGHAMTAAQAALGSIAVPVHIDQGQVAQEAAKAMVTAMSVLKRTMVTF